MKLQLEKWRREWDSNPRPVAGSPVFKTGSLNRSDISPNLCASIVPHDAPFVNWKNWKKKTELRKNRNSAGKTLKKQLTLPGCCSIIVT